MPLNWNLKKWLAVNHDIYKATELQAVLAERTDVRLSLQALSALLNNKPHALRVTTIQMLCNAFNCKMSDFCDVSPDAPSAERPQVVRERTVAGAGGRLPIAKKGTSGCGEGFPDPFGFGKSKK